MTRTEFETELDRISKHIEDSILEKYSLIDRFIEELPCKKGDIIEYDNKAYKLLDIIFDEDCDHIEASASRLHTNDPLDPIPPNGILSLTVPNDILYFTLDQILEFKVIIKSNENQV